MNRIVSTLLVLSVLLLGSCQEQQSADYPHYDSVQKLADTSDLIITAEIRDHEERDIGNYRYDVYSVSISEVYKSDGSASEILEIRYQHNEVEPLTVGSEYLFFLETYGKPASPMTVNVTQATYKVNNDSLVNAVDSDDGFEDTLIFISGNVLFDSSTEVSYAPIGE